MDRRPRFDITEASRRTRSTAGGIGVPEHGIPGEISDRLRPMREAAHEHGEVLPPLLILGTSERVGSNWISDTLRPVLGQHNEPFRQQLAAGHPLSSLNPYPAGVSGPDLQSLGPLGQHWLVTFAASKYVSPRQAVKETNLFFALPGLLALFPDAPVLVLSRSPLGVASSFERGGLFRRWDYAARYRQMVTMTQNGDGSARRYQSLVPDDDPPNLVALTRLQVLNTVLLAAALADRDVTHIPYETAVIAPRCALGALIAAVPELADRDLRFGGPLDADQPPGSGEDTFATTKAKTALVARLDPASTELIRATTAISLAAAQAITPASVAAQAATWLAGDHRYRLEPLRPRPAASRPPQPRLAGPVTARYFRRGGIEVRNLLVSNTEYMLFLGALARAGMPNDHGGTYLLACEMPQERGGRLHQDRATGRWQASPEYEDHPADWVTWIGAAAFAAWHGARLPTRAELIGLTSHGSTVTGNAAYRHGDVTPVTEPGRDADEIHHLLGNLQTWCADGPDAADCLNGPSARWLYGVAWNTPGAIEEARRPRHRHILGSSRGVGIRLVHDGSQRSISADELAGTLSAWIAVLADRSRPLAELDEWLIRALDAAQADAGLGPHVAPGTGETCHG